MTYGEAFRYFRKSKGLTLKQVADDMNSVSLVAQFEKNQTNIAVDRFVHLLSKINVTYDEFQLYRQGHVRSVPDQLIHQLQFLSSANYQVVHDGPAPLTERKALLAKLKNYHQHHYSLTLDHYLQIVNGMERPNSADHLLAIRHYLYTVDTWGVYEVNLFKQSLRSFTPEQTMGLLPLLRKKTATFKELPGGDRAVLMAYFTTISGLVANRAYASAEQVWRLAHDESIATNDVAGTVLLPYMLGWIRAYQGKREEANRLFDQTIHWYHILQLDEVAHLYQEIRLSLMRTAAEGTPQFYVFESVLG